MYRVTFQPGARTAWHTHTGGPQILLVIEGSCRLQKAAYCIGLGIIFLRTSYSPLFQQCINYRLIVSLLNYLSDFNLSFEVPIQSQKLARSQ